MDSDIARVFSATIKLLAKMKAYGGPERYLLWRLCNMNSDDWHVEGKLPNGGLRVRHLPTKCVFEIWQTDKEVRALLRQGTAGTELFEEAKAWFHRHWMFAKDQGSLF